MKYNLLLPVNIILQLVMSVCKYFDVFVHIPFLSVTNTRLYSIYCLVLFSCKVVSCVTDTDQWHKKWSGHGRTGRTADYGPGPESG